jgi:hypothetical protein
MTQDQQQIAIAEACGWTAKQDSNGWWRAVNKLTGNAMAARLSERSVWSVGIPDYLDDLNAMHEAEKVLDFNQLRDMEDSVSFQFAVYPFHATASQRAEAFLRTLGLWTETPTQPQ